MPEIAGECRSNMQLVCDCEVEMVHVLGVVICMQSGESKG